jgi:hypothetical protein
VHTHGSREHTRRACLIEVVKLDGRRDGLMDEDVEKVRQEVSGPDYLAGAVCKIVEFRLYTQSRDAYLAGERYSTATVTFADEPAADGPVPTRMAIRMLPDGVAIGMRTLTWFTPATNPGAVPA